MAVLPTLADEHGVVLGTTTEHLDGAADLFAATDHRIELAGARQVAHVAAILLKRLELRLVFCRGNAIVASKLLVDLLDTLARYAGVVEHTACIALVLSKGHEQVLGYHETIAHLARVLLSALEHANQVARKPDLGTIARYLGGAVDGFLRRAAELRRIGTDALDDDRDVALAAREQRRKQMDGLDGASLGVARDADGRLQRLPRCHCQLVDSHANHLSCMRFARFGAGPGLRRLRSGLASHPAPSSPRPCCWPANHAALRSGVCSIVAIVSALKLLYS